LRITVTDALAASAFDDATVTVLAELDAGPDQVWLLDAAGNVISDDYTSIQDAIDAAVDGQMVLVGAGEWLERVVIDKAITLRGHGDDTIIRPVNDGVINADDRAITVTADGVTIESLQVQGSFYGIYLNQAVADLTVRYFTAADNEYA